MPPLRDRLQSVLARPLGDVEVECFDALIFFPCGDDDSRSMVPPT